MNKRTVIFCLTSISALILLSFAFANVGYLQELAKQNSLPICSTATVELKLCTEARKIVVSSGADVSLVFTVSNLANREVMINRNFDSYRFIVTNGDGVTLSTEKDRKLKSDSVSEEEQKRIISSSFISRRPDEIKVVDTTEETILLSEIYNLREPGTYWVKVSRTTKDPNGDGFVQLSLEGIEIEVK